MKLLGVINILSCLLRIMVLSLLVLYWGSTEARAQEHIYAWTKVFGGTQDDYAYSAAKSDSGNLYVTGSFAWVPADFDPESGTDIRTNSGFSDVYLSKYDASDNYEWTKTFGGNGTDIAHSLAIDGSENVYVAGLFENTVDFDPGPGTDSRTSAGQYDVFLSKYDSSGNYQWTKAFGGTGYDSSHHVIVDDSGNVYVGGAFYNTVDFDSGPGTDNKTSAGQYDVFLSKYNSSGNYQWTKTFGGADHDWAYSVIVDVSGNLYVGGYFGATVDFDPGPGTDVKTSAGLFDTFLSKLDESGNYEWTKTVGGTQHDMIYALAIDSNGNLYVRGGFHNTVDFDPGPGTDIKTSAGWGDMFLSKYDASGNYEWTKTIGGTGDEEHDWSDAVMVDDSGNVYVGGGFSYTVDFDPGPGTDIKTANGSLGAFLSKYGASGNYQWTQTFGSVGGEVWPYSLAGDRDGNIYVVGYFAGSQDFDPRPGSDLKTSAGSRDPFVSKLNTTYTISGTLTAGGYPLSGVTLTGSGTLGIQTTDSEGKYSFTGVLKGTIYTVTPTKAGYSFSPTFASGTHTGLAIESFTASPNDTDHDGISDIEELSDGTDPQDAGSYFAVLNVELCSEWNGFLSMYNIMEHVNMSSRDLKVHSQIYSLAGEQGELNKFSIKTGTQFDLLVHDMDGYGSNTYGSICSKAPDGQPGELDGRMVFYKPDTETGGYQFAFAMPLGNGLAGNQYVPYNTYQPSLNPADASNLAANWIQLTNFSAVKQTGSLVLYAQDGSEIARQAVTLGGGARFDYSAHDLVGRKEVGLVEWIPTSTTARFQLRNVRYYYRTDGVIVLLGDDFDSAFQLEGVVGSGQVLTAPLDTESSSAVLEIANTLNEEVKVQVSIFPASGENALHSQTYKLKSHATYHLIADEILQGGQGIAIVQGNKLGSIMATAMQYDRTDTLGIQSVYGIQAREAFGTLMRGSYNTFLKQGCRLLMANPTDVESVATVGMKRYNGAEVMKGQSFSVPAHGLINYDLCSQDEENVYGVVTVQPENRNTLFATVLRIGQSNQYRFPTPVRQ